MVVLTVAIIMVILIYYLSIWGQKQFGLYSSGMKLESTYSFSPTYALMHMWMYAHMHIVSVLLIVSEIWAAGQTMRLEKGLCGASWGGTRPGRTARDPKWPPASLPVTQTPKYTVCSFLQEAFTLLLPDTRGWWHDITLTLQRNRYKNDFWFL